MEFSSSNPYASPRHVVGNVASARDPSQGMPGVPGSIEDDPRQNQRENTVKGRQILVVMLDDQEISLPCSRIKCILESPDAILWVNPKLSTSGARRMAPYEAITTPMASDPHSGQDVASARTHVERTALVTAPNPAIDDVDIEYSRGHDENEWTSQSSHQRPAPSTFHEVTGSLPDRKETVFRSSVTSPVDESSFWNSLGPKKSLQSFPTNQYANVEGFYNDYRHNTFSDANIPISNVPTIHVNQASDTAPAHASILNPSTLYGSARPHGPGFASVKPDMIPQALHPDGNPMQAILGLQQGNPPTYHDIDHRDPSHGTLIWPEAPTPEVTIGSSAAYPYQEPAMPDKQQVNTGSLYAPRQLHPGIVQLAYNPIGQPRRGLRAPQSAAQKAMKSGKPRGRRTKALTAAQKDHARIVRKAGRKKCNCGQRKVKCTHVVAESPHSPGTQGPGKFLAAPHAQGETAICGEPDTPSSQNTSWLTENTPVSPFSPSRNQSFGNTAEVDMPLTNLFTEDFQPFNDNDDGEGEVDDEGILDMDNLRRQLFQ